MWHMSSLGHCFDLAKEREKITPNLDLLEHKHNFQTHPFQDYHLTGLLPSSCPFQYCVNFITQHMKMKQLEQNVHFVMFLLLEDTLKPIMNPLI